MGTRMLPVISDLWLSKVRAAKSRDYYHVIIFDRLRFQNVFRAHENEKAAFSKTGLKNDFKKLRFDDWLLCPLTEKQVTILKLRARFFLFAHKTQKLFYFVRSLLLKCHCTCGMTMKAVLHTSFQNGSHSNTPLFSPQALHRWRINSNKTTNSAPQTGSEIKWKFNWQFTIT